MKNLKWIWALTVWAVIVGEGVAAEVKATLSADQVAMGVPVQLQIRVEGSANVRVPRTVDVDGLLISQRGWSSEVQQRGNQATSTALITYQVLAQREGIFEIPAIQLQVDGEVVTTDPVTLEVTGGGAPHSRRAIPVFPGSGAQPGATPPAPDATQRADPDPDARLAFAEMVIPRESVFVGELVPVEIRFYFNKNYGFRLLAEQPTLSGEGFTVEDLTAPKRGEQMVDGTAYHVFSFQSAITPVKSGELEIPGVNMPAVVQVPSQMPRGFDDLFSQFFGNSGMTDSEQLNVTTDPVQLPVRPLPKAGRPENFAGAIGDFSLVIDADPKTAAAGDPLTLRAQVKGRGNFGAMGGPSLVGEDGWRSYPPSENFDSADAIGFGGTKTYDYMIVATSKQTETPGVEFSFFDPAKEEYVTLEGQPVAVVADAAVSTPTPGAVGDDAEEDATLAASGAEKLNSEVPGRAGVLEKATLRTFAPPVRQVSFLVVNGLGLLTVLGLASVFLMRRLRTGERARRAALRQRHAALLARLRETTISDEDFLVAAEDDLDVLVDLTGADGREELIRSGRDSDEGSEALNGLGAKVDERKFASGAAVSLGERERRAAVAALAELGGGR